MIETVISGLFTSAKYCVGSGGAFIFANVMPEDSLMQAASAVTGWALAIACIWTLSKTVKFLYAKIEEKDKLISGLHQAAEMKADKQRDDMLDELKKMNVHEP